MPKLLFDLLPIALFFVAFKFADVYVATAIAIAATVAQIAWLKMRGRPIETMQWTALGVIAVFGGLTLWLHDETFIKWKPTILYWLFGGALLIGRLFGRDLVRRLMQSQMRVPEPVWLRLNSMWIGYFALMGAANLWVAHHWSTDAWVNFKLFGTLCLTVVFVLLQAAYLGRHMIDDSAAGEAQSPASQE